MPDEPPLDILRCDGQASPHGVIIPETVERGERTRPGLNADTGLTQLPVT